jgi:alanine dehydrogenase
MNIGIPKEIGPFEYRVGLTPAGVEILCQHGHTVFVEHTAGEGARFPDLEYEKAGASIVYSPEEAYGRADFVLKIARPTDSELSYLQKGTILAGLLNLPAARQNSIDHFIENNITCVSYEQISESDGSLPVLRPLSMIAGAMSAEIAARLLHSDQGGRGILLGGIPGVPPAEVVILGGGTAGMCAAQSFTGLGAHVTVLDKDVKSLQRISQSGMNLVTMVSTERNIARCCSYANVLVAAVLIPWTRSPILVTREMVQKMKPRSVIIDLSIDEGGCVETSRPTTHDRPTYLEENVIHYCVPNMPALVARTAMHGFVNVATPYILEIADLGLEKAMERNPAIKVAVNIHQGTLRNLPRWNV